MKTFKLFCEAKSDKQLDWILDKISKFGEENLSPSEKDYLKSLQGETKDIKTKDIKTNAHYNQYITKLLSDIKNGEITEEMGIHFVEKYVSKEDLFSVLIQLLKDGKIDHLTNDNI
jgi:hypothetical protein